MQHTGVFTHCEFGHLLVLTTFPGWVSFFGHVHESEALSCAQVEAEGWPRPVPRKPVPSAG